jgi:uncharacterized protein
MHQGQGWVYDRIQRWQKSGGQQVTFPALQPWQGIGLRPAHYAFWHAHSGPLPWLEVIADNHLFQKGGPGFVHLERLRSRSDMVLHGVGLSIAGPEELSSEYLQALKGLCHRLEPATVSDHLCFTRAHGRQTFDLLPVPFTEGFLKKIVARVNQVQETLGRRFALENVSSYVDFLDHEMSEIEFLAEVCRATGCGLLLDVNNLYVSAFNHGFDPYAELVKVRPQDVVQYHVAGHSVEADFLYDTHDKPVCDDVWALAAMAWSRIGPRPFVLEHDDESTPPQTLKEELQKGQKRMEQEIKKWADPTHLPKPISYPNLSHTSRNFPSSSLSRSFPSLSLSIKSTYSISKFEPSHCPHASQNNFWQKEFAAGIQSPLPFSDQIVRFQELSHFISPASLPRLEVYRVCYFMRLSKTLADTLFALATSLMGLDVISGLIGRFLEDFPATSPHLTETTLALPAWAEEQADVKENAPWLPDLLRLCQVRWDVLTGDDGDSKPGESLLRDENPSSIQTQNHLSPALDRFYLNSTAKLFVSRWPIFDLSRFAQAKMESAVGTNQNPIFPDNPQSVLVFKSSPTDLQTLNVPADFVPFVRGLTKCKSVQEALESWEKSLSSELQNSEALAHTLQNFLRELTAREGLRSA